MADTLEIFGVEYSGVTGIKATGSDNLTKTYVNVSDTTATAADVPVGVYFYTAAGIRTEGTMDILNTFYPVGSYYETSDSTFNPNTAWGGTWNLESEGQVHVGAGNTYTLGATGGEATVTLDATMIPAHTHNSKSLSGVAVFRRFGSNATGNDILISVSGVSGGICSKSTQSWSGSHAILSASTKEVSNPTVDKLTVNATHEHDSVGGGLAHNNMPPYVAVNRWHRTA